MSDGKFYFILNILWYFGTRPRKRRFLFGSVGFFRETRWWKVLLYFSTSYGTNSECMMLCRREITNDLVSTRICESSNDRHGDAT
jgi:hypothetical protein